MKNYQDSYYIDMNYLNNIYEAEKLKFLTVRINGRDRDLHFGN